MVIAKSVHEAQRHGEECKHSHAEVAYYDTLAANNSVGDILVENSLKAIARKGFRMVLLNTAIDWTVEKSFGAHVQSRTNECPASTALFLVRRSVLSRRASNGQSCSPAPWRTHV
jgi:hypothetical protein